MGICERGIGTESRRHRRILPMPAPAAVSTNFSRSSVHTGARLELPTLAVAFAVHGGFLLLTWYFRGLPLWLAAPLAALVVAWHGSFQHETIHGHPTPWRRINRALGS